MKLKISMLRSVTYLNKIKRAQDSRQIRHSASIKNNISKVIRSTKLNNPVATYKYDMAWRSLQKEMQNEPVKIKPNLTTSRHQPHLMNGKYQK